MKISTHSLKLFLPLTIISLTLFFSSCGDIKKPATGEEDEITVVADSSEYWDLEADLLQVFGKIVLTPQEEALFHLKRASVNKLESVKSKKNILIIAPLNSGSYTSRYINSILDSTVTHLVQTDSVFMITRRDLWAANQLVMILTAPTMEKLKKRMLEDHENLLYQFKHISDQRLYQNIYNEKYEQKKVEAQLLKDYGWMIYVQADYFIAKNDSASNFVWMRRAPGTELERWVFIHWIDNASPAWLRSDSISAIRNRMTKKFYRSMDNKSWVEVNDAYKAVSEVNFNGKYAIATESLWKMSDESMGGPYVNYTFYDENTRRLYMLDGSVFAPKYYKKKLIQQLDVTLHSFLTDKEINKERKEDLMDALKE